MVKSRIALTSGDVDFIPRTVRLEYPENCMSGIGKNLCLYSLKVDGYRTPFGALSYSKTQRNAETLDLYNHPKQYR